MVFEAVVDVLILSGGRRTQVGIVGAIAFHLAMCLFGWAVTIYALIMVPALALLLRAERRAAAVSAATVAASTAADLEVAGEADRTHGRLTFLVAACRQTVSRTITTLCPDHTEVPQRLSHALGEEVNVWDNVGIETTSKVSCPA